jgi:hypothetical protein
MFENIIIILDCFEFTCAPRELTASIPIKKIGTIEFTFPVRYVNKAMPRQSLIAGKLVKNKYLL